MSWQSPSIDKIAAISRRKYERDKTKVRLGDKLYHEVKLFSEEAGISMQQSLENAWGCFQKYVLLFFPFVQGSIYVQQITDIAY